MSIQSTFNQGLALTAGLLSLNPTLQQKALDRKEINAAQTEIDRSKELAKVAVDHHNTEVQKEQQQRYIAARKKQAEVDPEKYGWRYVFDTNRINRAKEIDGYATKSLMTSTETKSNIQQGLDDREEILKQKKSLRQTMKADGFSPKEIRQAYSDKKRGNK